MADKTGYFSRSWALLTKDKGWIKPLLVMGISSIVPIVGALGVSGYILEWARLTAWGVDSAPKQKGVDVGQCIKSGWRGFLAAAGWGLALGVINAALTWLFDGSTFASLITLPIGALAAPILAVCSLRATIYQSAGAGYQANRIFEMVKRDFSGFLKVVGMYLLISAVVALAATVCILALLLPAIVHVGLLASQYEYGGYSGGSSVYVVDRLLSMFTGMLPIIVVMGYLFSVMESFMASMLYTGLGLWMRQFNVPAWGASADPLPDSTETPSKPLSPEPVLPVAPSVQEASSAPEEPEEQLAPEVKPVSEIRPAPEVQPASEVKAAPSPATAVSAPEPEDAGVEVISLSSAPTHEKEEPPSEESPSSPQEGQDPSTM